VSVYTKITLSELKFFFDRYDLGTVIDFEGIANGIDNSNYFVETTQGRFVLTLFETLTLDELPHYIKLLTYLANYHIPCPRPQLDKQGNAVRLLNNKPAAIFKRLAGVAIVHPTHAHCQQIGLQLAELHDCIQNYKFPKTSNVLEECRTLFNKIESQLIVADRMLIDDELRFQTQYQPEDLPTGVIHADLFRDNVLFDGNKLSGVLDFYMANNGTLLFDIAITANDWCCDKGVFNTDKVAVLLAAYEVLRPLNPQEKQHWQTQLRLAALQFWLLRLEHQLYLRQGDIVQQKDPLFFRRLLEQHRCSTEQPWRPTFNQRVNTTTNTF
jgi:homoserine kinase type II